MGPVLSVSGAHYLPLAPVSRSLGSERGGGGGARGRLVWVRWHCQEVDGAVALTRQSHIPSHPLSGLLLTKDCRVDEMQVRRGAEFLLFRSPCTRTLISTLPSHLSPTHSKPQSRSYSKLMITHHVDGLPIFFCGAPPGTPSAEELRRAGGQTFTSAQPGAANIHSGLFDLLKFYFLKNEMMEDYIRLTCNIVAIAVDSDSSRALLLQRAQQRARVMHQNEQLHRGLSSYSACVLQFFSV